MQRRYIIASIIGIAVGLLAIASESVMLAGVSGLSWNIPDCYENLCSNSAVFSGLAHRALWLRTCGLFLDHGFSVVIVSAFAACALVKLTELGKKRPVVRCLSRSIWLAVWMSVITAGIGALAGLMGSWSKHLSAEQFLGDIWGMAFFFLLLFGISFVPLIAIISFVGQIGNHFGFFSSDPKRWFYPG